MNFKSILAAGALAVAAAVSTVGMTSAAQAETRIQVYLGGGYYEPAPVYRHRAPVCAWWEDCGYSEGEHFVSIDRPHRERRIHRRHREVVEDRVSCRSALRMVSRRGFHDVRTRDCEGTSYRFVAWKHGHQYMVKVNARNGSFNAYPL